MNGEQPNDKLNLEQILKIYNINADWIRFADTKAGAVMTAAGLLAGLFVPKLEPLLALVRVASPTIHAYVALVCFFIWLALTAWCIASCFGCILPRRHPTGAKIMTGSSNLFHNTAITASYAIGEAVKFADAAESVEIAVFKREVLGALLMDAYIAKRKYQYVTLGIRLLAYSCPFALAFMLFMQY